jgi:myo-inositol-1(or 4)-monophosphatase
MRSETEAAIRAAAIAQGIADTRQGADEITSKGGIDLVTRTDVACEDAIRGELLQAFPDYPVIGEERGGTPVTGKPYWLVDPICGTRPFASNVPLYCTNIALVENGVVTAAAIGLGRTGEILFAEKGGGAHMRSAAYETRIAVSDRSNTIWIDGGKHATERAAATVHKALLQKQWYVWMFSSTLSYAYLATGRIAGIIQFGVREITFGSVHFAAGVFIAAEAGAIVTDTETEGAWTINSKSFILAPTHAVHQQMIQLLEEAR